MASACVVTSLKRKLIDDQKLDYQFCIFCQAIKIKPLQNVKGKQRVTQVAVERVELSDSTCSELDLVQLISESDWSHKSITWHHICYLKFTS